MRCGAAARQLVAAAQRAGVRRVVAESVIFGYGYSRPGRADGRDRPVPGPTPPGGAECWRRCAAWSRPCCHPASTATPRESSCATASFYGPGVPHHELFNRLAKWWGLPAMTGNGMLSWVAYRRRRQRDGRRPRPRSGRTDLQHRRRPAAVVRRLRPRAGRETGQATALADLAATGWSGRLVSRDGVRAGLAAAVQHEGEGRAGLDAYSPVKFGGRFSNIALMPSVRSFDGRNAEFHAAT